MCALFILVGTCAVSHMCCRRSVVISSAGCPPFCNSSAVIPSGPGALFLGILASSSLRVVLLGGGPFVLAGCRLGGVQD